jgi:hypothetical protein
MAWGIGGWLLTAFLQKIGFEAAQKLRERVAAEIKTTFASTYAKEVSLAEALRLEEVAVYSKQATGQKYLINPNKEISSVSSERVASAESSQWPDDSPVNRNGSDHAWLERHPSTPLGRQQRLGLEIANPEEDQLAVLDSGEAHSAEADMGGSPAVLGENDLIGRQGDLGPVSEDHRRSRRTVLQDRQLRHHLRLAGDTGTGHELDEQRIHVHISHSFSVTVRPMTSGTLWIEPHAAGSCHRSVLR